MRGYDRYNFDAFDAAEKDLQSRGWTVISPAQLDREFGFDPDGVVTPEFLSDALQRDIDAVIKHSDAIALLPGWECSSGAQAEMWIGKCKEIPIYFYPSMVEMGKESILEEAIRITSYDRQKSYGPPKEVFDKTAKLWSIAKGVEFKSHEVAIFDILQKVSRETYGDKRDNWVDMAGYAGCGSKCVEP
jgi:hypothetical protein